MVLDIYSDFINNFSLAMETAKQASKNKSAFADFLKVIFPTNKLYFYNRKSILNYILGFI